MPATCVAHSAEMEGGGASSRRPCKDMAGPFLFDRSDEQSDELSLPSSPLGGVSKTSSNKTSSDRSSSSPESSSPPSSSSAWGSSSEKFAFKNKVLEMVQMQEGSSFLSRLSRTSSNVSAASTLAVPSNANSNDNTPRPFSITNLQQFPSPRTSSPFGRTPSQCSNDEGECPSPRMLRSADPPSSLSRRRSSSNNLHQLHINALGESCNSKSPRPAAVLSNACSSPLPSATNSPRPLATTPRRSMRRALLPSVQLDAADLALLDALPNAALSFNRSFSCQDGASKAETHFAATPLASCPLPLAPADDACSRTSSMESASSCASAPAHAPQSAQPLARASTRRRWSRESACADSASSSPAFRTKRLQSSIALPGAFEWADTPAELASQSAEVRGEYNKLVGARLMQLSGGGGGRGGAVEGGAAAMLRADSSPLTSWR